MNNKSKLLIIVESVIYARNWSLLKKTKEKLKLINSFGGIALSFGRE